ncbi:MAG: UDP-N-acetylmuramate dehydrogenase [Eubacterium sp.]|nr:UDP-N-acetylmuramate dehydrogenase [Eubacterium sp.]
MRILCDVDMKEYTSFRAGGRADIMYVPDSPEELAEALAMTKQTGRVFLGNGSNTLVKDSGLRTPVIKLGPSFSFIELEETDGPGRIRAGAGALMSAVASFALEHELTGFENISGIPGSIGGAVFMNAGAYGTEIRDVLDSVDVLTPEGEKKTVLKDDLDLSYRHSSLMETGDIVLSCVFALERGEKSEIAAAMKEMSAKRREKQPLSYPSAGSFFKRPPGYFAGKLVQDAGLKGLTVGGAQVSPLHSGFIINKGGASASDILDLMRLVQNIVYDKYGVMLEPEVRILGD